MIDNLNEKLEALGLRETELSEDGYWVFYLCIRKAEAMHRLQGFDTAYAYQRAKEETDKFGSWLFLPDLDEDYLDLFTLLYEELSQASLRQYMRRIGTSRIHDVDMVTDLLSSFSPDAIEQTTQLLLVLQGKDESYDEKKYGQYVSLAKYCRVQRVLPEPLFREIYVAVFYYRILVPEDARRKTSILRVTKTLNAMILPAEQKMRLLAAIFHSVKSGDKRKQLAVSRIVEEAFGESEAIPKRNIELPIREMLLHFPEDASFGEAYDALMDAGIVSRDYADCGFVISWVRYNVLNELDVNARLAEAPRRDSVEQTSETLTGILPPLPNVKKHSSDIWADLVRAGYFTPEDVAARSRSFSSVDKSQICFIAPSSTFVRIWSKESRGAETTMAVPYECAAEELALEFWGEPVHVVSTAGLLKKQSAFRHTFLFWHGIGDREHVKALLSCVCQGLSVWVYMEEREFASLQAVLPKDYRATEVHLLPTELFHKEPKKHIIVKIVPVSDREGQTFRTLLFHYTFEKTAEKEYVKADEPQLSDLDHFDFDQGTFRKAYEQEARVKGRKRQNAEKYFFSPELSIWVQSSDSGNGTKKVQAYLCEKAREESRRRRKLDRGKKIPGSSVWIKSIPSAQMPGWVENIAAYNDKLMQTAVRQIRENYTGKAISLKSIWYCVWPQMKIGRSTFKYGKELFETALGRVMIDDARAEEARQEIQSILETTIQATRNDTDKQVDTLQLINRVMNEAVRNKLIACNPVSPLFEEAKKEQRRRNAVRRLARKNYTEAEEKAIYDFLTTGDRNPALAAAGMIKLFTGLKESEIAALNWEDFSRIKCSSRYRLTINKKINVDGQIEELEEDKLCRQIPIMKLLSDHLLFKYKRACFASAKDSADASGAARMFPTASGESFANQLRAFCKEAEKQAGIRTLETELLASRETTDLSEYRGDRFYKNFEYRCLGECGMSETQTDYLMRRLLPDTLSACYCDFGHECIQDRLAAKLDQWGQKYALPATKVEAVPILHDKQIVLHPDPYFERVMFITLRCEGKTKIEAQSEHGIRFHFISYQEQKGDDSREEISQRKDDPAL